MNTLIFSAIRTPRGAVTRKGGALAGIKPIELISQLLKALPSHANVNLNDIEDLVLGCVTQTKEQGANLARIAALYSGWPDHVSGITINRFCTSGLDAVAIAAARIMSGECDVIAAGGVESMSRVPMFSDQGDWFTDPQVMQRTRFTPLGVSADLLATIESLTREDLDAYALESQRRAVLAREQGVYRPSIVPVTDAEHQVLLADDEPPRDGLTMDKLAALPPAFVEWGAKGFDAAILKVYSELETIHHLHSAGNSPAPADGAGLILLGNEAYAAKTGLKPKARVISFATAAADPMLMLTAAEQATEKALAKAKLAATDMHCIEVNEAFAATVLRYIRHFKLDPTKVNIHGGAIARGHAMGATGAMLIAQTIDELERNQQRYGLVAIAGGGGVGTAMVIERVI